MTATATLGQLIEQHGGSIKTGPFGTTLKANEYSETGVPIISVGEVGYGSLILRRDTPCAPAEVTERLPEYLLETGDIVFGRKGAVDRSAWVKESENGWFLGSDGIRVRLPSSVDSRFVAYQFQDEATKTWLLQHASGSTMLSLNQKILARVPLQLPEFTEQRAIAEVLGALDDKIAANTKLAASSEDLITAQYQRATNSEGIVSQPLFSVIDFDFGEAFKGSEFSEPGFGRPLIRIRDLKTFTSQVWTKEKRLREILVQPGDVVVGMDAEFRPTVWLGEPGLLNQRVCRARGKFAGPAFVREALKEPLGRIEGYKAATTVIHLNKKDLEEAEVLVPSLDSLTLFESSVEALYSQRVSLAIENRTLSTTRDTLLPQLMSGKLRVKDAEKVLEVAGV